MQGDPIGGDVLHVDVLTPALLAQLHQGAVVGVGGIDLELHVGLFNRFALLGVGQGGRVVHHQGGPIEHVHQVDHRGRGDDQIQVVFPLQPFLHNFHVQQAQKATAKAKAHGTAGFGLIFQGRIRELELVEGFAQVGVLVCIGGEEAAKHHRLGLGVTRQGLRGRIAHQGDRVAHPGIGHGLDRSRQVTHLPGME